MTTFTKTSSTSLTFGSYNLLDLYDPTKSHDTDDQARTERVYQVIRALDVDVLAVQEVMGDHPDPEIKAKSGGDNLAQLAEATGMKCALPNGKSAIGIGNARRHTGLLWKEGITPTGGYRAYSGTYLFNSLLKLHLDVGGYIICGASYQAIVFGRHRRADEAEMVVSALTRPFQSAHRPPGIIGGDWNGVSADRVFRPSQNGRETTGAGNWVFYDEEPDYQKMNTGEVVYQTTWKFNENGQPYFSTDREAGEILSIGGLRDVAAALDTPWEPTVGHWDKHDPLGKRRIDAIRVTQEVVPALLSYSVISDAVSELIGAESVDPKTASDHLPIVMEYEPSLMNTDFPRP